VSEIRLQRALARAGVASRRQAEALITAGRVRVDGKVAELGSKVDPARQAITVDGKRLREAPVRWLAFHKPMGVVTTASDEEGRRTVYEVLPQAKGLAYVGRLDVNTTGLLLLTNDGDAIHRLAHPRWRLPRRYTALVHGRPAEEIGAAAARPVEVEGRRVEAEQVKVRPGREGRSILDVTLREGRNRIVRRWCEAMGLKVERLARLGFGPVRLGDLPVGAARPLTPAEIKGLYAAVRLEPPAD
jgi:23S rRNA pseudouridine2605 synthase